MPDTTIQLRYFLSNLSDFIMNVVCDLDATPEVVDELDRFKDQIDDIISDVYQEMGIDPYEDGEVDGDDEVDELPVESRREPRELHGFESQGSIRSRLSMFQRNEETKQESSTTTTSTSDSSDSEHHHPVKADQEYYARQQQLAALPRSELKVYSYELLTVGC